MCWSSFDGCLLFRRSAFGFKGKRGYARFVLDVAWLLSVGECWPALFSGVMPSVGGVTSGACVMFAHALGVTGGSDLGVFVGVRGCQRATEGKSFRTSRR